MKKLVITLFSIAFSGAMFAQVDYSQVSVPQEVGLEFTRMTADGDYVYMPAVKSGKVMKWEANRVVDINNEGTHIAYLSKRGNTTNIFIKDLTKQGSSVQRTKRALVRDFVYSPDGKYILIKNQNNYVGIYSWVLYWEREGNESISETLKRQPQVIDCYEVEWQGEAIAWRDNNTFYTTSDASIKDEAPIYKYTREGYEGMANITSKKEGKVVMIDNILYVRSPKGLFTLDGRKVQ